MKTLRIIQNGRIVSDGAFVFRGASVQTGTIGKVACYLCVRGGSKVDPRRGMKLTPRYFGGPCTVEVIDSEGNVETVLAIATVEQVAAHPRCTSVAASARK